MTDWRDLGPQFEAERARLAEYEQHTANMTRAECEQIIDRAWLKGAKVFLCGRKPGPTPLEDLRSLAAEMLFVLDED